ncbi:glycosyltransferase [Calothrix sp. PCC 7507]|uniref:glycosyltransferase n=1 Tax=Calothrix sp. PCC 7507 TaxID=99598 RepID=UPI00029F1600|nr:glycosyltransferase [Calothrix sp. PCC 7507]AFY32695.1 glycosyl transferase group 1 [Calothrix sp. PCC 7507]
MTDLAIFLMDLRGGGAERVMLNLAEGFAKRGLKVDLILVQAMGDYLSQIPPNVRVIKLGSGRLVASLPALVNYLKKQRPTTLLSALEDTNIIAILGKQIAGVSTQVIVTVHNNLSQEARNSKQLKRRIIPYLIRWFYPWADAVVGVSQGVVDDLIRFGSPVDRTYVIYNPIVTQKLLEKIQEPLNHSWFLANQPPVILGVGRLDRQKDFSTLIHAFSQVRQQYPLRLIILGEGNERANLEALVDELGLTEDVILPGFVPNPYAYMACATLLVLSSVWEGFGNVLVEAMAAGTHVVSTDCESGPAEILANGEYGKLVHVGDVEGMAKAIAESITEPPDQDRLKTYANKFSLENALMQYEKLLASK